MSSNAKDIAAGGFFTLLGLYFCINAWMNLTIGTAFRMGPGYFPIMLGGILALLGIAILVKSLVTASGPIGTFSVRGTLLIGIAPVVFGVTVRPLGLVAAIFLSTFVAAMSSRRVSILLAFALSAGLTIFCIIVFVVGLGLPMRLFGPWLSWLGGR